MQNKIDHNLRNIVTKLRDPECPNIVITEAQIQHFTESDSALQLQIVLAYPISIYQSQLSIHFGKQLQQAYQTNKSIQVQLVSDISSHAVQTGMKPHAAIKNIIAIASAKGGVGKSTVTTNLALALAAEGARVGILDADIYGPSQPTMMGISGKPASLDGKTMEPILRYGIQLASMGFLVDSDQPMIWRGPMVTQALQQLLMQTNWRSLDYLLVDMPPGTGDIQLTLMQKLPVTAAVIVTTPQEIALMDARKGLRMFQKMSIPVVGVIENMAYYQCSHCGHHDPIFAEEGGAKMAAEYEIPYLGAIALNTEIRRAMDAGKPSVVADVQSDISVCYRKIARQMAAQISLLPKDWSTKFPPIVEQKMDSEKN